MAFIWIIWLKKFKYIDEEGRVKGVWDRDKFVASVRVFLSLSLSGGHVLLFYYFLFGKIYHFLIKKI